MDMNDMRGGGAAPPRPIFPDVLIEATIKAIKAGMKPEDFTKPANINANLNAGLTATAQQSTLNNNQNQVNKSGKECCLRKVSRFNRQREREDDDENLPKGQGLTLVKSKGAGKKLKAGPSRKLRGGGGEDEDSSGQPERTYRNLDERQMGFLIVGDQHRFVGAYGADKLIFPAAPPLDFSFCMINKIEEIVINEEHPQTSRLFRIPDKTPDERYQTSSLWLSYNVIIDLDGLINVLYKVLDGGPRGLCWLDVSFNAINKIDEDTLAQLPNLKILYLHGNMINDMTEVRKLQILAKSLTTLTIHGNPVEEEEGYRIAVIYYLPDLLHLDFSGVSKADRANSLNFGRSFEPYWGRRHEEMEANFRSQKKAAEISYTDKVMQDEKDDFDDVDFNKLK